MFDIFKKDDHKAPTDVKVVRDTLLRFIKQELQKVEGGEGWNIKGINIYLFEHNQDKHLYESAVFADEPERFKNEIQKIADDYAIGLPQNWSLEVIFTTEIPEQATKIKDIDAALFISTKDNAIRKSATAYIRVLNGEAEKTEYQIGSADGKINIGREKMAQVSGGFFRLNHIAFPGESANESNKYISRQHAHIEWNNDNGSFMFYADDGGIPPGNKVKIKSAASETLNKLNSKQIGHKLIEGDQVILGETAVIAFSYKPAEEHK